LAQLRVENGGRYGDENPLHTEYGGNRAFGPGQVSRPAKATQISGSDMRQSEITDDLALNYGAKITIPHHPDAVEGAERVIYSAAVRPTNVEYRRAKELGIELLSRKGGPPVYPGGSGGYAVGGAPRQRAHLRMLGRLVARGLKRSSAPFRQGSSGSKGPGRAPKNTGGLPKPMRATNELSSNFKAPAWGGIWLTKRFGSPGSILGGNKGI